MLCALCLLHPVVKVVASDLSPVADCQHRFPQPSADQVFLHLRVIFQIRFAVALLGPIKRRLRNVQITSLDDFRHLPVKEGEQQRPDVAAVDIGVRHDDDLVIPGFFNIEFFGPDTRP